MKGGTGFFVEKAQLLELDQRKDLVERKNKIVSIQAQCRLLTINRSTLYYKKQPENAENIKLMRLIDEQYMKHPEFGSRSMRTYLEINKSYTISRKRVRRLMRKMEIEAIYPKPRTSKPHPAHKVYPYLLRGMQIDTPNKVWASDITFIPMAKGYLYLVAIMDWYSRKVLAWELSNTQDAEFCLSALDEAISKYGPPEIFNTDQGSQFTSKKFTGKLKAHGIKISMDGRGRWLDNVFIERLWWSVKYQYLNLWAFESGHELKKGLSKWFKFYNHERPHQGLNEKTPDEVYFNDYGDLKAA